MELASANGFFRSQYLRHRGKDLEQERRYLRLILIPTWQVFLSSRRLIKLSFGEIDVSLDGTAPLSSDCDAVHSFESNGGKSCH